MNPSTVRTRRWRANNPGRQEELAKAWKEANREKVRASNQKWREANPNAYRAQTKVNNAVRDGKIPPVGIQECRACGGKAQTYHHIDVNYAPENDLAVIPLCRKHHKAIHQVINQENDNEQVL